MKIYLASRFGRQAEMREVAERLRLLGHEVTSRWLTEEFSDGGRQEVTEDDKAKWASYDFVDVQIADAIISFTEPPGGCGRGGRHVEHGLALAWHKLIIVVGYRENVFHWLPGVRFYETTEQMLESLSI